MHDHPRIVDRQGGLRDIGQRRRAAGADFQLCHVIDVFHQVHGSGRLAHGAFHLRVALVADHHDLVTLLVQARHLQMHLGHQRAGGVEHVEAACGGGYANRLRYAMGAEDHRGAVRYLVQIFDEPGALGLEPVYHVAVVHHFVAHIDRRTEFFQRALDDGNRAFDAGAETSWVGEQYLHQSIPMISTSKRTGLPASGWLKSTSTASSSSSRTMPVNLSPLGAANWIRPSKTSSR